MQNLCLHLFVSPSLLSTIKWWQTFWTFLVNGINLWVFWLQLTNLLNILLQWRIYIVKFWTRAPPPGVQILSISCSFWEILAKSYVGAPPGELAPPPRGNPRSATVLGSELSGGRVQGKGRLNPAYFEKGLHAGWSDGFIWKHSAVLSMEKICWILKEQDDNLLVTAKSQQC